MAAWGRLRQSRIISHLRLLAPSAESPVRGHSRDWDVGYCHNMEWFCNYCFKRISKHVSYFSGVLIMDAWIHWDKSHR